MNSLLNLIICLAALPVALFCQNTRAESPAATRRPPNIVLIIADDQGYGDCSAYPNHAPDIRTPHIDSIARTGVTFTQGYVSAPVCSPSRTGLITGRYQQRFNKEAGWRAALPERATTVAEHLRRLGYATMMIGKNDFGLHVSKDDRRYPMNHGYDRHLGFEAHAHDFYLHTRDIEQRAKDPHGPSANVGPLDVDRGQQDFPDAYTTELFTDTAIDFAKTNVAAKKPFFVTVSHNAVHDIVQQSPQKYLDRYGLKAIPLYDPSMGSYLDYYHVYNRIGKTSEADMRKYYLANLACLDDNVGRLLGALDGLGVADNTLVVYMSDNGSSPNTGGNSTPLRGSKFTLFEGGLRVPFLMKWPAKIKPAQTLAEPVISLDLLPTFVEAAGGAIKPEDQIDGVSLLPRTTDAADRQRAERTLYWKHLKQWGVRRGDWKLVLATQPSHKEKGGNASWLLQGPVSDAPQLFNLKSDPAEQTDLSTAHPEIVKELTETYRTWESRHGEWGHGESGKY
jgi:arylsulfatase A-like enzyme